MTMLVRINHCIQFSIFERYAFGLIIIRTTIVQVLTSTDPKLRYQKICNVWRLHVFPSSFKGPLDWNENHKNINVVYCFGRRHH